MNVTFPKDIQELAQRELIASGKPHAQLKDCKIIYALCDTGTEKVGKAPTLWKALTGKDIVIRICEATWKMYAERGKQLAYLDHLLSHIEMTNENEYLIAQPGIQEFVGVLERHGAWRKPIEHLNQLQFDLETMKPGKEE